MHLSTSWVRYPKVKDFFLPVAAAKALRNISFSAACVMETIVLVTDVPMLEPKIIGMAFFTGAPAETKATKMQEILFWFVQ